MLMGFYAYHGVDMCTFSSKTEIYEKLYKFTLHLSKFSSTIIVQCKSINVVDSRASHQGDEQNVSVQLSICLNPCRGIQKSVQSYI